MSKLEFLRRWWPPLLVGIIIGLGVAAGLNWTHQGHAELPAVTEAPAPVNPNPLTPDDLTVADGLSNVFAAVSEKVNPSVVTIFTETDVKVQQSPMSSPFEQFFGGDDFFKRFFQGPPNGGGSYKSMGLGSGVIVNSNGTILTNNHVVDDADNIKIRLFDGREFEAKVKGKDPQTDLAVVTIDANDLKPISLGNSERMRVGDWVLAVGSPLNPQLAHTITAGIISAKGRSGVGLTQYEDYIQTDAAINPGNSGGALVNLRGELIGINSAIATQTGGNQGIGFAIPVNLASKVLTDIVEHGSVTRGWLGVYIQNITPELAKAMNLNTTNGVLVSQVQKDSPAARAGLQEEDIILKLNGEKMDNSAELSTRIASTSPGSEVTLTVLRDGREKNIEVKLDKLNPKAQELAQGMTTVKDIGLQVANKTSALMQKYHLAQIKGGVVVTSIDPRGVAAGIGVKEGDVILKINRSPIKSVDDFQQVMGKAKPGSNVLLYLLRGNANLFVAFTMPGN